METGTPLVLNKFSVCVTDDSHFHVLVTTGRQRDGHVTEVLFLAERPDRLGSVIYAHSSSPTPAQPFLCVHVILSTGCSVTVRGFPQGNSVMAWLFSLLFFFFFLKFSDSLCFWLLFSGSAEVGKGRWDERWTVWAVCAELQKTGGKMSLIYRAVVIFMQYNGSLCDCYAGLIFSLAAENHVILN